MEDVENVIKKLSDVSEMLFQMYKDETDKENISIRYDQFLAVDNALALLKEQKARIRVLEEELRALKYGDQDTLKSAMMPAT